MSDNSTIFQKLFHCANAPMLIIDSEFRIIDCNSKSARLLDRQRKDIIGLTPLDISSIYQKDGVLSSELGKEYFSTVTNGHDLNFEWTHTKKDGTKVYVEVSLFSSDKDEYFFAVWKDLTELKIKHQELLNSEAKHRAIVENISDAIILINEKAETVYQSPSVGRISGYTWEESLEKKVFEFIHPDDLQIALNDFQSAIANPGVTFQSQFRILHKSGQFRWLEGAIINLLNNESVKAFVINYNDITKQKTAEENLKIQNQKLRDIAFLQSHIVRSPIATILGIIELINTENPADPLNLELIPKLNDTAKNLDSVIHEIVKQTEQINQLTS